jgi:prepilin-type N-terminal cleavage/methylation domain-containing protein
MRKRAFTLLELLVVVIIIGVLVSLALPRFAKLIETAQGTEAINGINVLRKGMEMCYLAGGTYQGCNDTTLPVTNPGTAPGARYRYQATSPGANRYYIVASEVLPDGSTDDMIALTHRSNVIVSSSTKTLQILIENSTIENAWGATDAYKSILPK